MDYTAEYNKIYTLIEEAKQTSSYADAKKTALVNSLLSKRLDAISKDPEYDYIAQELKQDFTSCANSYYQAKYTYEMTDPTHDRSPLQFIMSGCLEKYSELSQLNEVVQTKVQAETQILEYKKQLNSISNIPDEPQPNPVQQMDNVQSKVQKDVAETKVTATSDGHVYPVAMVQSWTKELQSYNKQLKGYVEQFNALNLDKVDRTWLQKQVAKFVAWIKERVNKLKEKITKALNGMMKPVNEIMGLVKPILSPPSLKTIITWANNIIKYFMAPYQKVIQFVTDFATYTPPLMKETATLAGTAASVPPQLLAKVAQLKDEATDVVKDNLANAGDFESANMGNVNTSVDVKGYQKALDDYKPSQDDAGNPPATTTDVQNAFNNLDERLSKLGV